MIRSMTGFGAGHGVAAGEELDVEVRSVNHKFCEVKVRLPREYAALELEAAKLVKERLARGGVDVSIRRVAGAGGLAPRVDAQLAEAYARAFAELQARLGLATGATLTDILSADGVVRLDERDVDLDAAREAVRAGLSAALEALVEMRAREGAALARDLAGRLDTIEALAARVAALTPEAVDHHRARLEERVAELARGIALDPARLAQEVALLADRSDVTEELIAAREPRRAGARPARLGRARRTQARLPRPGDAPRGEHDRLEVAERRDRRRGRRPQGRD